MCDGDKNCLASLGGCAAQALFDGAPHARVHAQLLVNQHGADAAGDIEHLRGTDCTEALKKHRDWERCEGLPNEPFEPRV